MPNIDDVGLSTSHSSSATPLPVFLQPTEINFVVSKPETHKQVLTCYNPYDFPLRFTVLSNAPNKYRVVEPRGFIRPKCYVDIMIRHLSISQAAVGANDLLRIETYRDGGDVTPCGRKDIPLNLLSTEAAAKLGQFDDQFKTFPQPSTSAGAYSRSAVKGSQRHVSFAPGVMTSGPMAPARPSQHLGNFHWLFVFGFFTCVITLMLPTYEPPGAAVAGTTSPSGSVAPSTSESRAHLYSPYSISAMIPLFLRPTHTLQLVAAYVLGLLTVYLIQPNNP